MGRLGYLIELLHQFVQFAAANKAWWLVPVIIILMLAAGFFLLGHSATPLIYTLF